VLAYFLRNPKAVDSLEDVARWRVPEEAVHFKVEQIDQALRWLVTEQLLVEERPKGVGRLFRLNTEKSRDAELFMEELSKYTYVDADGQPTRNSWVMIPALAWINAALVRYLRENPPCGNDQPGLTRSHESIEALLSRRSLDKSSDLEAARRNCDAAARALAEACETAKDDEPLAKLYRSLGLTWLEIQTLLLCLAPELDANYQITYGVLNDDMGRRTATLGLICRILGNPLAVRTELETSRGLTQWRFIESGNMLPHEDEPLRLDAALVSWLLGPEEALLSDARLCHLVRSGPWPGGAWLKQPSDASQIKRLADRLTRDETDKRWLALCGEDADGWRALVEAAAYHSQISLIRVVPPPLTAIDTVEWEDSAARMTRAVVLLDAVAVLDLGQFNTEDENSLARISLIMDALNLVERPTIVIVPDLERVLRALPREGCNVLRRDVPDGRSLAAAYVAAAAEVGLYLGPSDAEQLALTFPLSISGIDSAVRLALLQGAERQSLAEQVVALTAACRRVASPALPRFARRVDPTFSLADVVLPKDRHHQLREMVAHVKHASQVLNTWGFGDQLPYGRGVAALFSGPSGTGKTMAAQAIARELHTETYVVDLSRVVSKYIGETEKFIDATFRDAQRAGAVLQIDEAEALFGKRSEIKEAHDRYANIEVAYLLQRMEAFDGVAILTTNLRQNLDQAFLRRLRFVVDFPKPDAAAREAIWLQCLPQDAPFHEINVRFLARRLELTGVNIRQITVRAAFAAAAEGSEKIEMSHLIAATRAELLKLGMPVAERELVEFENARRQAAGAA